MKKCFTIVLLIALALVANMSLVSADGHDWWAEAAAPYAGATIRGVSESTPPSNYVADVLAAQFTELTGINVEFETTSWDQMYSKAINDMEANTGIYDFVYIEQDIIYSYLAQDYLVNLTQYAADHAELAFEGYDEAAFTSFADYFKNADGDLFGVPMEAFVKVYLYRKDLFEDADIMAAFEEEYGYALAPATTFDQYRDIAEFFTAYGESMDMDLWGTTVQGSTGHPASTYEFLETIGPSFGLYNWGINLDAGSAQSAHGGALDGDTAVEALTFWLSMLEFAPPEATSSTWDEVASSFAAGRAAQGWVYGENAAWIATDESRSAVTGNVGVEMPVVAPGVMQAASKGEGYIGYYDGGAFGIPHSSRNKEATLLWLQFIGQESVQAEWAAAGARITHTATFSDPLIAEQDAKVDGYYSLLENCGPLFAGAPPFPFHAQVREIIDPFIQRAILGELAPADALSQAAMAVDEELTRLGYGM